MLTIKKWAILGLFFVYFHLFKQTLQFLQQIYVNFLWPSSIRRRDSNPWPSEHNYPPITTIPGLLLTIYFNLWFLSFRETGLVAMTSERRRSSSIYDCAVFCLVSSARWPRYRNDPHICFEWEREGASRGRDREVSISEQLQISFRP